jgi:AraC-like DNA-binding protein
MAIRNAPIDGVEKRNFSLHKQVGQYQTEWHSHARHQLLYAEGGVVHLQTEYHHFLLPARHGAWIPNALPHRVWSNSPALYLRTLYFGTEDNDDDLLQRLRVFSISSLAREMILYTQDWDETSPPNLLEQHFFETLRLLVREWLSQAIPLVLPSTEHLQVEKIVAYIHQHLSEPLQINTLAEIFGFSGRTLMRLFKKEMDITLGTYVRVARIIWALELLTQPDTTVTEVAFAVGYRSLGSFSQTFRQLVGVWPQEYLRAKAVVPNFQGTG